MKFIQLRCPFCSWKYKGWNAEHLDVLTASNAMVYHLRIGCPIRQIELDP